MKITFDIPESLFHKIELLSVMSGIFVSQLLREAVWREAHHVKPFIVELMEKECLDSEKGDGVKLLRSTNDKGSLL